jgi:acetyl esterase/lipase
MRFIATRTALFCTLLLGAIPANADPKPDPSSIPFSSIASPEARRAFEAAKAIELPPRLKDKIGQLAQMTAQERRDFYRELRAWDDTTIAKPLRDKQKLAYKVDIAPAAIGGVYTEIFTPVSGILPGNADRVLINLHGGGFTSGARTVGQIESIPIAAVARIKVISVDYRQAPEFQFPAATDDVLAVYRELLKTHKPGNIGIYGCSAGGTLTAQVTAAIIARKIPRPGAIGMFCGTGEVWAKGDSAYFWALLKGLPPGSAEHDPQTYEYLRGLDTHNPLIFPMRYPEQLGAFPPSLLISGTRAFEMSTIIDAHNKLAKAGVDTHLHIWDGVTHAFLFDPTLPESREAYDIIARFFAEKLGP